MRFFSLLALLLLTGVVHAQTWELVTPIKTRSDLAAVRMHSPTDAVTIDRTLGHVLRTTDAGDSWARMPYNLLNLPRSLWMWDDQRGIIGAETGRFYRTTDNWSSASSVDLFGFGHAVCLSFVNDTLGWAASESGKIVDVFAGKEYLFTATVNEQGEIHLAKNSSIAQEMIRRYTNNENIKLRPV